MSEVAAENRGGWFGIVSATATAVVVGFASTILLIMEAARAVGADAAQQASWAAALCFGMAVTSFILSWRYRMPIITAWSTPGAALIATSATGVIYANALGAFLVAGALMTVAGLIKPLEQAIERIPTPIAAAMLAGVLFNYALGVPAAAIALPLLVVPLIVAFFALRLSIPLYAVPVIVGLGLIMAALSGSFSGTCCSLGVTKLVWTTPGFDPTAIVSLGVPLFLVTMASQNLPGFAVLRASGYAPPVSASLLVTGVGSMVMAPFGSHSINLAAITASIVTGPDTHPDPARRWLVAFPYLILYGLVGLAAASFVQILGSLPGPLITAIAGLALFSPLMGGLTAMLKEPRDIETALVTFLVTASGVTLAGVGSAFWGLVAGLLLFAARHLLHGAQRR
ncbi:MAG: benzoate/H(+) symporter BenE family transporter [Rhizobiales bacterium]|nr:benzoate/H(+) symporter BenE family transporter [Hyphomicrobiales bacterium]MBI3673890.1 benzoate/H(+) symporter BenE family transporter [Hyphomicrobiales bacterium]